MKVVGPFEIDSVVLCEQIREEVRQKLTLNGVFGGDITLPSFPATFPIAVFIQMKAVRTGAFKLEFQFSSPSHLGVVGMRADVVVDALGWTGLPSPSMPFECAAPGDLVLKMRADDGEWIELTRRLVSRGGS